MYSFFATAGRVAAIIIINIIINHQQACITQRNALMMIYICIIHKTIYLFIFIY
jgi:hypothetical protein